MDRELFLQDGEQVFVSDLVREHSERAMSFAPRLPEEIMDMPESIRTGYRVAHYIREGLHYARGFIRHPKNDAERIKNLELKGKIFRTRDIDQILEEGYFPSCSDIGMVFRALMIAQGIPVAYVETLHENMVLDRNLTGHVLGRIFDRKKSYLVDPTGIKMYDSEEDMFKQDRYVIFKEGLDSWDIGIRNMADLRALANNLPSHVFNRYEDLAKREFYQRTQKLNERRGNSNPSTG